MQKTINTSTNRTRVSRRSILAAAALVMVWSGGLLIGGCTSDPTNIVGAGLVQGHLDSTLLELKITMIDEFSGIQINEAGNTVPDKETLYLGRETDADGVVHTRASFLVNFDFSDIFTDEFPEALFDLDSIKTVKLSLTKLVPYLALRDSFGISPETDLDTIYRVPTGEPLQLFYIVHELDEPFDPLAFEEQPTDVPSYDPEIIVQDHLVVQPGGEPSLKMYPEDLLRWAAAGTQVGVLFRLMDESDPGLVGFASGDLTTFSEVPNVAVGTIVGPNIIVDFLNRELNLLVGPQDDTTVYEELEILASSKDDAADGFQLRTGARSYPTIRFDLANLPPNVLINRAVLSVTNDTLKSFGPEFSIQASEIAAAIIENPDREMDAADMKFESQLYPLSFRANLIPTRDHVIEFDVTTGVRRAVNNVNPDERGFMLGGVEDKNVFPFLNRPPDVTGPDFYFRQMNFRGLEDPDPDHRPHLKVWYSVIDELSGGAR